MTALLYSILYAGGIVFLAGCAARAVRYARQPFHLRWEIHPVPRGRSGQLKVMVPEILFLKGLWEFNRTMWFASYPFHLGLYLLAASAGLVVCAAVLPASFLPLLHGVYAACGTLGTVLGLAGSVGLLARRVTDRRLRLYSRPGDYFNLAWFALTFVLLLVGLWLRPADAPGPLAILRGAAGFDTTVNPPAVLLAGLVSGALLLAYIPFTHMAHFIAKYFTYHAVRWDERSAVPGGSMEKRIAEYLMYRPTWSAPHMGPGGRTWAEVAATNPARGGRK
jgi:nitrate reductase gamma subunit